MSSYRIFFQQIYDQGDIYKGAYKGLYCTPCESYWTKLQLDENGCCPDCHRPVQEVAEEAYFFRMSKYADRLIAYINEHPDFIQPVSRRNEMIAFIEQGLEDLCVSRTSFDWGIPVPFDPKHVVYVWFDALTNYLTPIGYLHDKEKFSKYWPADVHLVGKEIVRFHTIIWGCMLMALGLDLPKRSYGHGCSSWTARRCRSPSATSSTRLHSLRSSARMPCATSSCARSRSDRTATSRAMR